MKPSNAVLRAVLLIFLSASFATISILEERYVGIPFFAVAAGFGFVSYWRATR